MASSSKENQHQTESAALKESGPPKTLVVDDDHITLTIVCRMMEAMGYQVEAANGGLEAMNCLIQRRYDFDLLVTDFKMPDMNGYALSGWLKCNAPDTKVIIMTGCHRSEVANYLSTGIVDCWVYKPICINELRDILSDLAPAR